MLSKLEGFFLGGGNRHILQDPLYSVSTLFIVSSKTGKNLQGFFLQFSQEPLLITDIQVVL